MAETIAQYISIYSFMSITSKLDVKKNLITRQWSYVFCGKLNRLSSSNMRWYDLQDAVVYLHEYFRQIGWQTLSMSKVREWYERFNKTMTDEVLRRVNRAYSRKHGQQTIRWEI